MPAPLTATETLERGRAALQNGRGAGLPELLQLIETLSTDLAKATVTEIAELIERDAAVLCRVLTVANTIVHNPNVAPMASITHAIHQIGFQRVRNLAVSLMLLESSGGAGNPPEQREAAARALCSSLLAQSCARSLGTVDPELAFTCTALRHFGEILLPAVSLEHYRAARQNTATRPEDSAYREQFGLTPLELSRELLGFARLSPEVTQSLRDCQPELMAGSAATTYGSRLLSVADLGGRMARLALESDDAHFSERSRSLAERFERLLPGVGDSIGSALSETVEHVSSFARCSGTMGLTTPGLRRMQSKVHGLNRHAEEKPAPPTAAKAAPAPDAPCHPTPPSKSGPPAPSPTTGSSPPADDWREKLAAANVMETPAALPSTESDPWLAALTFVRDSFGAEECWVFLPKPGGASLPISQGVGPLCPQFRAKSAVRADERTVFGVCLSRGENVLIHDTTEPTLAPYLPEWFRLAPERPGAFLLMPLAGDRQMTGLVLIGWRQAQRIAVTATQTELARQLFLSTLAGRTAVEAQQSRR